MSIIEKEQFISQLLNSISVHPENILLFNMKDTEFISVCEYFFNVVQLVHYFYSIEGLHSAIDKYLIPRLSASQPSEHVEALVKNLETLRSTPLKLSELARKLIRIKTNVPTKNKFQNLGLTGHLVEFLVQSSF